MANSEEPTEVLPTFISNVSKSSPIVYFHHIIDAEATTLTVQVLGANLSFRFSHLRAKTTTKHSTILRQLENKTTGFVALATPASQRIVLAVAESGHGLGRHGDLLDKKQGVLPNSVWTRRVVAMGKTLGLNMRRPYDNPHRVAGNTEGIFLGSHVEVKLAVHGICVLLETFGITKDFDNVTMEQLRQLRNARWEDGSRPVFEVYFSRKHCHPCRTLARKLQEATGVTIRLVWKHRLIMKTYPVACKPIGSSRRPNQAQPEQVCDSQDYDFGDILPGDSDIEVISDDEEKYDCVDTIDLTNIRSTSPRGVSDEIDALIDGLAYRVGQMEGSPEGATAAIVGFAQTIQAQRKKKNSPKAPDVNKPLPATPVIEAPVDVIENNERHTVPRAKRTLFGGSRGKDHSRARSVSPFTRRRDTVRERSPRRYNLGSTGRLAVEIPGVRSVAKARSQPRSFR